MREISVFIRMKKSTNSISFLFTKYRYIIIFIAVFVSWLPVLFIPFINDDYQILGYHFNKGFISLFQPFWSQDVSQYYWRPVGNLIHPLILLVGGFHPFYFRLVSLLIYFFCCIVMMNALEEIGIGKIMSVVTILIFAVLPSHELQVAWIADQGEALFTIFLILAFTSYYRAFGLPSPGKYIFALACFFIAILIKETAFAGVFIPLIVLILKENSDKKIIRRTIFHSLIAILLVLIVLAYRFFIIGGTPINPVHFASLNPFQWIINFFVYIPLSFVPPEALEWLKYESKNWWVLFFILIVFFVFVYTILRNSRSLEPGKKRILFVGIVWFIIFVIPALPNLMRWYVFTASFGLIIMIAVYLESFVSNLQKPNYFYLLFIIFIIAVSIYNFNLMVRWNKAGAKLQRALTSLNEMKDEIKTDSIYVWAVPDKLDRIPMMKLGVMETVQWALNNNRILVNAPLRVELINSDSRVKLVSFSGSHLVLEAKGGRFLRERSESNSIITNTSLSFNYEGNNYMINTKIGESGVPDSRVTISIGNNNLIGKEQLYFNGAKFVKIN